MSSFVLIKFITILLLLAHSCMFLNSASTPVSEFSGTNRVESSANLINTLVLAKVFKSTAKIRNNVGPRP